MLIIYWGLVPTACATTSETRKPLKAGAGVGQRTFAGHMYDDSTGLSYQGARYYDPASGRFLSEDPAFLDIGDAKFGDNYKRSLAVHLTNPQGLNSYAYANNNPLTYRDPDGKIIPIILGALTAYGVASLYVSYKDYRTVTDHPDVFTPEQRDNARGSFAASVAFAVLGEALGGLGPLVSTGDQAVINGVYGSLGVLMDAGQNIPNLETGPEPYTRKRSFPAVVHYPILSQSQNSSNQTTFNQPSTQQSTNSSQSNGGNASTQNWTHYQNVDIGGVSTPVLFCN